MKRSKLLFLTPFIALAAFPISSCADNNSVLTIEDVEKAIFKPCMQPTPKENNFVECLKELNDKDRKTELLYALYAPLFYIPNGHDPFVDISLWQLWGEGYFTISANISKCSLTIKEQQVYANYIGYVNLIFVKEWGQQFKKNDYLQFTLILDNEPVTPLESKWQLHFINIDPESGPFCWGILQAYYAKKTHVFYLNFLGWEEGQSFAQFPENWHNWESA